MSDPTRIWMTHLEPITDRRREEPLHDLVIRMARVWHVIGAEYTGAAVCGGALTRALLGLDASNCDLDLFVPVPAFERVQQLLVGYGGKPVSEEGSDGERPLYHVPGIGQIDVVPCPSIAVAIARFDIRCCAVATDGHTMLAVDGAREDLLERRLHVMRLTRVERVQKYLAMGLDLDVAHGRTGDELAVLDVDGFTDASVERKTRLGEHLHVEVDVVDLRSGHGSVVQTDGRCPECRRWIAHTLKCSLGEKRASS